NGPAGGDRVGYRRLLHVADDARDCRRAVSARWGVTDRVDGDGGNALDQLRTPGDGKNFRRKEGPGGGGRRGVQCFATGSGTGTGARDCRAGFVPGSGDFAGAVVDRVWLDLGL